MHKRTKMVSLVATATLAVAGLGVSASAATTAHQVHQADFNAQAGYNDTRSSGQYGFGPNGLVVETKDNSSQAKVAQYYAPASTSLPTSGSYTWDGSTNQPGDQVVFHRSGQTNTDYNVLVGEQVYSTNAPGGDLTDWWYTGGSAKAATKGITCPETTGGSGSDCHGTLTQWNAAVPGAVVDVLGLSLGSGVQGEGVLKDQTFGNDKYVFDAGPSTVTVPVPGPTVTPSPVTRPVQDVSATESHGPLASGHRSGRVNMKSAALKSGSDQGKKVTWSITIAPTKDYPNQQTGRYTDSMGAGETSTFSYYTYPGYDKTITVYKNGKVVDHFRVYLATLQKRGSGLIRALRCHRSTGWWHRER